MKLNEGCNRDRHNYGKTSCSENDNSCGAMHWLPPPGNRSVVALLASFNRRSTCINIVGNVVTDHYPAAPVISLARGVPPRSIVTNQFRLLDIFPCFPPHAVRLTIISPKINAGHHTVTIRLTKKLFIKPSGNLLDNILSRAPILETMRLAGPSC